MYSLLCYRSMWLFHESETCEATVPQRGESLNRNSIMLNILVIDLIGLNREKAFKLNGIGLCKELVTTSSSFRTTLSKA